MDPQKRRIPSPPKRASLPHEQSFPNEGLHGPGIADGSQNNAEPG